MILIGATYHYYYYYYYCYLEKMFLLEKKDKKEFQEN